MPKAVKTQYPCPPLRTTVFIRGGSCRELHYIMRDGKPIDPPRYERNEKTGLSHLARWVYPLKHMEVNDYFVVHREGDFSPKYDALRVYMHNAGVKMGKKFVVIAEKFPNLVVKRTK